MEDSDKSIYFPEEKLIEKLKLDKNIAHVITFIEEAVKHLKTHHNEKRCEKVYLSDKKLNVVVGSIVTEMFDGLESKFSENSDIQITFDNIMKKYAEKSKRNLNMKKNYANKYFSFLENIKEIENNRTEIINFTKLPEEIIMDVIDKFKTNIIGRTFNIVDFKNYAPNDWLIGEALRGFVVKFIKNECGRDQTILKLLDDYSKQMATQNLNLTHIYQFRKYYFNRQNILDEEKLKKDIFLLRGHSESDLLNS